MSDGHVLAAQPLLIDLPEEKANCIRLLLQWCDRYHIETEGKRIWEFYFDDGAYKGGWTFRLRQKDINPRRVLGIADNIGWPGLKVFSHKVDCAIAEIIKTSIRKAESHA